MSQPSSPDAFASTLPHAGAGPEGGGGPAELPYGAVLGRYVILRSIGRGGMGVVYAAYDPELDRKVAIKQVRIQPGEDDAEVTARLTREARAMARVVHPNVVAVHDVGLWQGRVFVAMELVEGVTLREWLKQARRSRGEILRVFHQAGLGLAAAHRAGLVHRDFKPDNVLVHADGRARVTDFGLVRPVDEAASLSTPRSVETPATPTPLKGVVLPDAVTAVGTVLGTPSYMAPEQFLRRPVDARTDQFAFAVCLYEALYQSRPFPHQDLAQLSAHVVAGRVAPEPARAGVPRYLRRHLLKALQPEPSTRFANMEELLAALERDPRRRALRILGWAVVALAVLAAPVGWASQRAREIQRCRNVAHELDGIWDGPRKAALQARFSGGGAEAWRSVEKWLDGYTAHWVATRREVCDAQRTGAGDARILAERAACLSQRRVQVSTLVDVLAREDAAALAHLDDADVLGWISSCDPRSRPASEAAGAAPPELEAAIDHAAALNQLNRWSSALAEAHAAVEGAAARGLTGTRARALYEQGVAESGLGRDAPAVETIRQAALGADATGQDELLFQARRRLAQVVGARMENTAEGLRWVDEARAALHRLGDPPEEEARLLAVEADVYNLADRPEDALPRAERALALGRSSGFVLPNAESILANSLSDLGRSQEALPHYQEMLGLQEQKYGAGQPPVAAAMLYLGWEQVLAGKYAAAIATLERTRGVLSQSPQSDPEPRFTTEVWLATAYNALGDAEHARQALARARAGSARHLDRLEELWSQSAEQSLYAGRLSEAEGDFRKAGRVIAPEAAQSGASTLDAATGLARVYERQGRVAAARAAFQAGVEAAEKAWRPHHPLVELARARAALLEDGPRGVFADALAVEEKCWGPEHPDLLPALLGLARAEEREGHRPQALQLLERAIAVALARPGDPWTVARARLALARLLWTDPAAREQATQLAQDAGKDLAPLPAQLPLAEEVREWLKGRR